MAEFRLFCVCCMEGLDPKPGRQVPIYCCNACYLKLSVVDRAELLRVFQRMEYDRTEFKRLSESPDPGPSPLTDEARIIKALENIVRIMHPLAAGIQRSEKVMGQIADGLKMAEQAFGAIIAAKPIIDDGPSQVDESPREEIDHDWWRKGESPPNP